MIPPVSLTGALEQARRLFKIYDKDKSGFIERHEIPKILEDTYKAMKKEVVVTNEDVENYLSFMVGRSKGDKISLPEFENVIKRSLEKLEMRGIKI